MNTLKKHCLNDFLGVIKKSPSNKPSLTALYTTTETDVESPCRTLHYYWDRCRITLSYIRDRHTHRHNTALSKVPLCATSGAMNVFQFFVFFYVKEFVVAQTSTSLCSTFTRERIPREIINCNALYSGCSPEDAKVCATDECRSRARCYRTAYSDCSFEGVTRRTIEFEYSECLNTDMTGSAMSIKPWQTLVGFTMMLLRIVL